MLTINHHAPQFELEAVNGERYGLNHPLTFAIFFKTDCPTCQYAWPFYERLYQAYRKAGLQVLGISQHDRDKTRQYQQAYNATFPQLVDTGWQVSKEYDPDFVPTGFLIDANQKIIAALTSWNREEFDELTRQIAEYLHVAPQTLIQSNEKVIDFKPG